MCIQYETWYIWAADWTDSKSEIMDGIRPGWICIWHSEPGWVSGVIKWLHNAKIRVLRNRSLHYIFNPQSFDLLELSPKWGERADSCGCNFGGLGPDCFLEEAVMHKHVDRTLSSKFRAYLSTSLIRRMRRFMHIPRSLYPARLLQHCLLNFKHSFGLGDGPSVA
jgi:hypothetical protein